MTSATSAAARSAIAVGVSLTLAAGALPAVAADATNRPGVRSTAAPSMVKPPSDFSGPLLTHRIYVVAMHGRGNVPPFSVPDVRAAAQQAGDYWVEQTGGAIAQFDVESAHMVLSGEPCDAINNVTEEPTAEWGAAAEQFPGVDFSSGQNHLVVVAPPLCQREGSSVATRGTGIGSAGKSLVGGLDVQTITQALGSNLSLGVTEHGFERDGVLQRRWHIGIFGPQSYSFDEAGPGALDVGLQDALGVLPIQQVEHIGATKTVSLAPVTQAHGVRGATFTDPVSGDRVWVEYRDGKGRDAGSAYTQDRPAVNLDETILFPGVRDCEREHGTGAVECSTRHVFGPGVRVYHVSSELDVVNIGLPRGFASKATLSPGDVLTGPGGGYTVTVQNTTSAAATIEVAVQQLPGAETPEVPDDPEVPGDPEPELPEAPEPVPASLEVTAATARYGTPATLDVSIDAPTTPLGEVSVWRGTKQLTAADLVDGVAAVELPAKLAVGTHALTVRYGGSDDVAPAEASTTVKVRKAKPRVKVKAPTAVRGKRTKITITAGAGLPANGKVAVYLDGKKRKTLKLSGGKATYRLPKKISVGKHTLQVRHLGSSRYAKAKVTTTVRVWRSAAKVKSFATGTKRVKARGVYRDTVRLSAKGVLQRQVKGKWKKVRSVPQGRSTVRLRAGKAGTERRYRIVIKNRGAVKGVKTKIRTIRAR